MARPIRHVALALLIAAMAMTARSSEAGEADGPLTMLARPGAWPGISSLIAYDSRIWFTNSEPFADTNAADVYSYDPLTGKTRYERGLFTQDTGAPVVFLGRLYWPFEDARFSMGVGEYAVTDGQVWRWRRLPQGHAFHLHAMAACGETLIAVTGAWEGQLQVSGDRGGSWRLAATYPKGTAPFSRLVAVTPFGDRCFVGSAARGSRGTKLLEWTGAVLVPVKGWPEGDRTDGLVVHRGRLFAWNDASDNRILYAFDGERTVRVAAPPSGRVRALSSDGTHLWAVGGRQGAGTLWRLDKGTAWKEVQRFQETPISVLAVSGALFVGTYAEGGGALWGTRSKAPALSAETEPFEIPKPRPAETAKALGRIETLVKGEIGESDRFRELRVVFQQLAAVSDREIGHQLAALYPKVALKGQVRMFTNAQVNRSDLLRWYLMGAMAVTGSGRAPVELLSAQFSEKPNRAHKYFDPAIAAIATIGWIGQDDQETVGALVNRLRRKVDPKWLQGDVVAALSALTGKRFGHDAARWRRWWAGR